MSFLDTQLRALKTAFLARVVGDLLELGAYVILFCADWRIAAGVMMLHWGFSLKSLA